MTYQKFLVDTVSEKVGILTGLLLDFGITGFEIIDNLPVDNPYDFDYEELKPELADMGGVTTLVFYMEEGEDPSEILNEIQKTLPEAVIKNEESKEEDWRDKWKDYFHSFTIGDILIKPSWEEVDTGNYKVIEIDPGVSFGTGAHETTRMCISALSAMELSGKTLLDAGCGSGILSIAAHLLGSRDITCVDIDPQCIDTTKENLDKNGISHDGFSFHVGDIMSNEKLYDAIPDGSFDVVCANILADIIITMLPRLSPKVKKGGKIILSGIIEGKEESVLTALSDTGIKTLEVKKDGEWFMIVVENE